MTPEDTARLRAVLDRMVREKEIAAGFFARTADRLEDVDQRRWFRRMAQDEKDQRKILLKHRRELCGAAQPGAVVNVSAVHQALEALGREGPSDFVDALRLAARTADEARLFSSRASDLVAERSCRIFLKILSEESLSHRDELLAELRRLEAARGDEEQHGLAA